jgi:hypothetical protein
MPQYVDRLVAVRNGDIYNVPESASPPSVVTGGSSRLPTTGDVGMAVVGGVLYIASSNENFPMVRYNGENVRKAASAEPSSAPVGAVGAAGVLTGDVSYKITYLSADGRESQPSSASNTVTTTADQVDLSSIPNDTDTERSGKNVYRRGPTSTQYKLVNPTPLSASATTYTDNIADASLGRALEETNSPFPPCERLWEHDNRLFGVIHKANNTTLFASNELEPWFCPEEPNLTDPTQGMRITVNTGGIPLTGGVSHGGYCIVFSAEGGYLLQGTSSDDYRLDRFTDHGCADIETLVSMRDYLFWLGVDGVYRFDGTNTERIDDHIRTFVEGLSGSDCQNSCAWGKDNRYYLSTPDGVRYYDTVYDIWGRTLYACSATKGFTHATVAPSYGGVAGDTRVFTTLFLATASEDIFRLDVPSTFTDWNGDAASVAYTCQWRSVILDMGLAGRDKRIHLWGFKFRAGGASASTVTCTLFYGSSLTDLTNETLSLTTEQPTNSDTSRTSALPQVVLARFEAVEGARCELFQSQFSCASTVSFDFEALDAEFFWTMAG